MERFINPTDKQHIMSVPIITFVQARSDETLRQHFLDILISQATDSIEAFVYDITGAKQEEHLRQLVAEGYVNAEELQSRLEFAHNADFYFVTPVSKELIGSGKKSPIFVYDKAFRAYGVEELFLNCILDHEGKHADHIRDGILLRDGTIINQENIRQLQDITAINLLEGIAYRTQLEKAHMRGAIRADYLDYTRFLYDGHLQTLRRIPAQNDFERQVISSEINGN